VRLTAKLMCRLQPRPRPYEPITPLGRFTTILPTGDNSNPLFGGRVGAIAASIPKPTANEALTRLGAWISASCQMLTLCFCRTVQNEPIGAEYC
jgi:hypothetical protein